MNYEVRNIKTFTGREGKGFSCDIWRDGKKVASALDDASGGEITIDWVDFAAPRVGIEWFHPGEPVRGPDTYLGTPEEKEFTDWAASEAMVCGSSGPEPKSPCVKVEEMVSAALFRRQAARWCRDNTVFRLKGDPVDTYRKRPGKWSPSAKAEVLSKYGGQVEEFLNEKMGAPMSDDASAELERLRKMCRGKTIIVWEGDPAGTYRKVDRPFTPALKQMLVARHGGKILEFVNERVCAS